MPLTFTLEAHPTAVEHGIWCPSCALPSAIRVTVALADAGSLRVEGHRYGTHCPTCDTTHVTR